MGKPEETLKTEGVAVREWTGGLALWARVMGMERDRMPQNPAKPYLRQMNRDRMVTPGSVVWELETHLEGEAGAFYGRAARVLAWDYWRMEPVPEGFEGVVRETFRDWHRDIGGRLKTVLYLTDVQEESGPVEYLAGSQRWFRNGGKPVVCTGPAGTAVWMDTRGLHRGGRCVEGFRESVTLDWGVR